MKIFKRIDMVDEKIIGIIGGMGVDSTLDLMKKILDATAVETEQDHIHMVVDFNPKIPDRTAFIVADGPSPAPAICRSIKTVTEAGADLILIPCNTAHFFFDELQASTTTPILHMVRCCAEWTFEHYGRGAKIGLLATTGTVKSRLYENELGDLGLEVLLPDPSEQESLMEAIYGPAGIKMGRLDGPAAETIVNLGRKLLNRGACAILPGCTEPGLALNDVDFPVINPVVILARKAVREVKGSP